MKLLALLPWRFAFSAPSLRSSGASRRARSRTTVLTGFVAVLLAHLWLAIQVETRKPHWRDPEYFHREHRLVELVNYRRSLGHTGPLVVAIGGSRPQMGLSPLHVGRGMGSHDPFEPNDPMVFDLVQSGMMPIGERLSLARLFATGVVPERILLELRMPALADGEPQDGFVCPERLGYGERGQLRPYHVHPDRVTSEWLRKRATSWFTLRRPLLDNWRLNHTLPAGPQRTDFLWNGMSLFGWSPFYPAEWPADRRADATALARSQYFDLLSRYRIESINDRLFRGMIAECQSRGVKVALYVMPESPLFRSWYPAGAREQAVEYLATLSREFGVPAFDASAWIDDESAFLDGHHLQRAAAIGFSERFGRECVGPWVGRTP